MDSDMKRAFERFSSLGYGVLRRMGNALCAIVLISGAAQAETVTIAALGDSLTAGYGLPAEDGFVPNLQAYLQAEGADVVVMNAGVSGDTTAGGLSRVGWTLTPEVDGMIVALGGNDYLRGIDPAVSRANLRGILEAADAQGVEVMLVGITAGGNYGPDYRDAFNGMYEDLAAEFDVPLVPTFFEGLLDAAGTQDRVRDYMQGDGIHPNAEGVDAIVATMGPQVADFIATIN